ncbi:hypothetical protein AC579_1827 [Pseudocercospora musae]|uniref:Uncharacterized protein n=1 Tax=Pseudocercospora musae TaxID=113226 RepID=A0A139I7Y6_9PEZI|nr:hypothetical protein AC579_1827 [Pseudocercospora musae]
MRYRILPWFDILNPRTHDLSSRQPRRGLRYMLDWLPRHVTKPPSSIPRRDSISRYLWSSEEGLLEHACFAGKDVSNATKTLKDAAVVHEPELPIPGIGTWTLSGSATRLYLWPRSIVSHNSGKGRLQMRPHI